MSFYGPTRNLLVAALSLLAFSNTALAADADAGKLLFSQCAACHMVGPDAQARFGPILNNIVDSPAASVEGYDYSPAFNTAAEGDLNWDIDSLNDFLKAPMQSIVGTKMAFPGVAKEEDRLNIIAYLATFSGDTAASDEETTASAPKSASDSAQEAPRPLAKNTSVPEHGVLHIGRTALEEEISAWDIDVRPDGQGLPSGSGTVVTGGELYDAQCASCHGVFGEGEGRWPVLAGGLDTLTEERPEKTIGSYWPYLSTVYDYVKRAMPFGNARSLTDDDVYAITAYLLYLNDIVDEEFELTDANFSTIQLPNEENFIDDTRPEEEMFVLSGEPCMTDCIEGEAAISQRAMVLDVTPDSEN